MNLMNRKGAQAQNYLKSYLSGWGLSLCMCTIIAHAAPAPRRLPAATENQLRAILRDPALSAGHVGVAVEALGTVPSAATFPARNYDQGAHPLLFNVAADQRYMPASNMKLFTAALALQQLGPETGFATRVWGATPHSAGESALPLLVLQGGGDPSFTIEDLSDLAIQVYDRGNRAYSGIAVDDNAFHAEQFDGRFPSGWTLDDSLWYYGASVSALTLNRNQFDVKVGGGLSPGDPVGAKIVQDTPETVVSHATTGTVGSPDTISFDLSIDPETGKSSYIMTGSIAPLQTHNDGLAVTQPTAWAAQIFERTLTANTIKLEHPPLILRQSLDLDSWKSLVPLAIHLSPPVSVLLQKFLKTSDNLYGEVLLRDAALYGKTNVPQNKPLKTDAGTAPYAHTLLRAWLRSQGINDTPLRFEDGSGLSRYNLLTPRAIVELLRAVQTLKGGYAFYDALPVAGVDGTLKKRMSGTPAQNNVRAKTGTFSIASCLSGYVTTRDGQRLAVSIMTNFVEDGDAARRIQDKIFATLAAANFRAK